MSNIAKQVLLQSRTPLVQFQRFRGKINIQRPQKPHYERARVSAITQPIYDEPPRSIDCFQKSQVRLQAEVENPYNRIIAKEVFNWLEHSKMVGIFHLNPINEDDLFKIRVLLHRQNITFKRYGKKIIKMAVENTKYEAILPLFDSSHCIVFSHEQKVAPLLKITRKVPQMQLLGGILENTLMSRNEFINYANLPNLQVAQAQFISALNMVAGSLVQNLEAHQKSLIRVLDVHAKGDGVAKSEVVAGTKSEVVEAKSEAVTEAKSEAVAEGKSEAVAEAKTEATAEAKSDVDAADKKPKE